METHPELVDVWIPGKNLSLVKIWKIPTPKENGIAYTIMMSFFTSISRYELYRELTEHLGENEYDEGVQKQCKNIYKCISAFNPFLDNEKNVFSDDIWQTLQAKFINKLQSDAAIMDNFTSSGLSRTINAALEMTKCSIYLFAVDTKNKEKWHKYYPCKLDTTSPHRTLYIIIQTTNAKQDSVNDLKYTTIRSLGFGMTKNQAQIFRDEAFDIIMKTGQFSDKKLEKLKPRFIESKNFLIFLLDSSCEDIIFNIFTSPFIAKKLHEAGFNTDPLNTDADGLSGFYHSILDISTLTLLYKYASCNSLSNRFERNSEVSDALNILENINKTLSEDLKKIQLFRSNDGKPIKKLKNLYFQVMSFNEFQIKVTRDIQEIRNSNRNLISTSNSDYFVLQKEMIILLQRFKESFIISKGSNKIRDFINYKRFNVYYKFLDASFSICFFDRFILLSTPVNDELEKSYIKTASKMLRYIVSENYFKHPHNQYDSLYAKKLLHRFIPYKSRSDMSKDTDKLLTILKDVYPAEKKVEKESIDIPRECLEEVPFLTDFIINTRIIFHLQVVISTKKNLKIKVWKRMLIVERTLQLLGELVQNKPKVECLARRFLNSFLSSDLIDQLCFIRDHCLAKHRANTIHGRNKFENDERAFGEIVSEFQCLLKNISFIYEYTFLLPTYEAINSTIESLTDPRSSERKIYKDIKKDLEVLKYERDKSFAIYEENFYAILQYMYDRVEDTICSLNEKTKKQLENQLNSIKFFLTSYGLSEKDNKKNDLEIIESLITKCKPSVHDQIKNEMLGMMLSLRHNILARFKKSITPAMDVSEFKYMKNICDTLKKYNIFNSKDSKVIEAEVRKYFDRSKREKHFCLENLQTMSLTTLSEKTDLMLLTDKERNCIIHNSAKNPKMAMSELRNISELDANKILKPHEHIADSLRSMTQKTEYRRMLLKLELNPRLKKKVYEVMNQKICFLINRIDKLEKILIEEDEHISYLLRRGHDKDMKKHAQLLVCRRYCAEEETRCVVQMLLFDCMNILDSKKLKYLWEKDTNLFTGLNMRHLLAHGNPFVEVIGVCLDSEDIPLALIEAIFKLIEDRRSLSAMSKLWYELKTMKISKFTNHVKTSCKDSEFIQNILSSERWEDYVSLLPLEE